ncbi:hypothetical protein [Aquimarina atlantica]|nr:hypothetical protein [Aquimarina atlantica]
MKRIKLFPVLATLLFLANACNSDNAVEEIKLNNENTIKSFVVTINSVDYTAEIDQENNTINLSLPYGTDLTQISPNIITSENASIIPALGVAQSFQSPKTYTITAENGDIRKYTITIIAPNDESKILSLVIDNKDSENIIGFIDEESKSILLEVPNPLELSALKINLTVSENATSEPSSGSIVDLSNSLTYKITAENGVSSQYRIVTYTTNQLANPNGNNSGDGWSFDGNSGVELTFDFGNIFYVVANDGDFSPNINQTITFPRDYSEKYILFIGNLTTEKVVEGSITRHPYLWAYQIGNFSQDDWIYMQGMSHTEGENVWQIVYGTHQLLPNATGTHFKIAQALKKGDPYDGTKSKYRDLEVRLFESSADAEIYVAKLYQK